jgi:hypothetical protein
MPTNPEAQPNQEPVTEPKESFKDILNQYEQSHSHKPEEGSKRIEATVVTLTADSILLDIGFKTEGILPLTALRPGETVKPGDKLLVTVKGRDPEGYYEVALGKIARPTDWGSLEQAFNEKTTIVGTVMAAVKGGLSVDVGVRAFMPASRSGVREAAEMEKLVGQEIRCRITKLDVTEEDVVVDRRVVAEEEERARSDVLGDARARGRAIGGGGLHRVRLHEVEVVQQADPHDAGHEMHPTRDCRNVVHGVSSGEHVFDDEIKDGGEHQPADDGAPERIERVFHRLPPRSRRA